MRKPKSQALYVFAAAFVVLCGAAAAFLHAAYKTVTVQDNGQRKVIRGFAAGNVESFLKRHQVYVTKQDRVYPGLSTPVSDGMRVVIQRPLDVVLVDGNRRSKGRLIPRRILTFARTVAQLLHERRVVLGPLDRVDKPLTSQLHQGETIRIRRVVRHVSTSTRQIPFQTIRQRTQSLYIGQQRVLTYGVEGLLQVTTTTVYVNGHKSGQVIHSHVIRQPVNQVIAVGSAERPKPRTTSLSSRGGGTLQILRELTVVATAYRAGGRTATGYVAEPGVIAVDPSVIPLGSKVYIPGVGVVRAEDTGGAIVGNRIDICMGSDAEARSWGVRTVTIYVIR